MRWALPLLILLTGCAEKESAKLERQYEMMKEASAPIADLCAKSRAIERAYLNEENKEKYELAKLSANVDCIEASMQE